MSNDNQNNNNQQNQQKQGGAKTQSGVSVGMTFTPADLINKETMAAGFVMGGLLMMATFVSSKVINVVRRRFFGIDTAAAKVPLTANEIVGELKGLTQEGGKKYIFKEAFGSLSDESKAQMKEWVNK